MPCCKPGDTLARGRRPGSLSFPRFSSFYPPASVSLFVNKGSGGSRAPRVSFFWESTVHPPHPPWGTLRLWWSNSCLPRPFFKSWVCSENLHLEKFEFIFTYKIGSKLKSTTSGPFCHSMSRHMETRHRTQAPEAARAGCARWQRPGPGTCFPGALPAPSWKRRLGTCL